MSASHPGKLKNSSASAFSFLDEADMQEHDRQSLHSILYSNASADNPQSNVEFPFAVQESATANILTNLSDTGDNQSAHEPDVGSIKMPYAYGMGYMVSAPSSASYVPSAMIPGPYGPPMYFSTMVNGQPCYFPVGHPGSAQGPGFYIPQVMRGAAPYPIAQAFLQHAAMAYQHQHQHLAAASVPMVGSSFSNLQIDETHADRGLAAPDLELDRTSADSPVIVIDSNQISSAAQAAARQAQQLAPANTDCDATRLDCTQIEDDTSAPLPSQSSLPAACDSAFGSDAQSRPESRGSPADDAQLPSQSIDALRRSCNDISVNTADAGDMAVDGETPAAATVERQSFEQPSCALLSEPVVTAQESPRIQKPDAADIVDETKPKSWASLFRNTTAAKKAIVVSKYEYDENAALQDALDVSLTEHKGLNGVENGAVSPGGDVETQELRLVPPAHDPYAVRLGQCLSNVRLNHKGYPFQLRGLQNPGNWCYVNASLQALLACPPLFHLLCSVVDTRRPRRQVTSTPVMDAMMRFVTEFGPDRNRKSGSRDLAPGKPFEPDYIYRMLNKLKTDATFKGRQEDAEECLSAILNGLHDEMVHCLRMVNPDAASEDVNGDVGSDNEWHQVGPGRRAPLTRQAKFSDSPIADIFVGYLRYSLIPQGAKESVSLQPFFALPLDIRNSDIRDIAGALSSYMRKEIVKHFPVKNKEVEALRLAKFEKLPLVLVLQLKCFQYDSEEGLKKVFKQIAYSIDLSIEKDLLTPRHKSLRYEQFSYKLFAVVFHHGEKAEGGHYTADIFHGGIWVNVDDTRVSAVGNDHVLNYVVPHRVPYLLFYRRLDQIV